ncbi:ABC transporter permease [Mesorhizobium hawassense]|uniref:ABC transporter permease n=1 Tax=Mesorhizobium hawassense TaxID=1209954 RepID=A0A330HLW1_9HYPH|nr:ABC transporter permease subunit [Mesorhizobium hawassense]RAZ89395.1 ABC transporter permease [Mesorhizobium hawassense]
MVAVASIGFGATSVTPLLRPKWLRSSRLWVAFGLILLLAAYVGRGVLPEGLYVWPTQWLLPLLKMSNDVLNQLLRRTEVFGEPLRMWTRAGGEAIGLPMRGLQNLLTTGWTFPGSTPAETLTLPPLSWVSVVLAATYLGWLAGGRRLAVLAFATFAYFLIFDLWAAATLTLASVAFAIVVGVVFGLVLGVMLFRWGWLEAVLNPVFDVMQTIPPFSYLVPVLILFGFGPVAALVATLIFALPPMARAVVYGLRRLPDHAFELSSMTGASRWQGTSKILLPSARDDLLLGVNQLVMMALAMVILASMIGAGGLGAEVLRAIQSLKIGRGLEAGIAITLLAVLLYGYGHSIAVRRPSHLSRPQPVRHLAILAAILIIPTVAGIAIAPLAQYPAALTISTADFWSRVISWLNSNWGDGFEATRLIITLGVIRPLLTILRDLGWASIAACILCFGFALRRPSLAVLSCATLVLIAAIGYWDKLLITFNLVTVGTLLSLFVGAPLGIWAGSSRRVHAVSEVVVTTLQTLPSFVYLVPVVMLLGPGDATAVIAIALYSVATTVRYTDHAIRNVDPATIEAAVAFGATPLQTFWKVRLPLARPGLMLGLNQTILMCVGMVVITALVGSQGLELETVDAIARVEAGRGLVAGLAISALAIILDRYVGAVAQSLNAPGSSTRAKSS